MPERDREVVRKLLAVFVKANDRTPSLANQGQALDGYSELHTYRAILAQELQEREDEIERRV